MDPLTACPAMEKLGRSTGLEPATPGTTNRCSNQLSYDRHGAPEDILSGRARSLGLPLGERKRASRGDELQPRSIPRINMGENWLILSLLRSLLKRILFPRGERRCWRVAARGRPPDLAFRYATR